MIYLTLKRNFVHDNVDKDADFAKLSWMTSYTFNPFNQWYTTASLHLAGAILDVIIPGDQF